MRGQEVWEHKGSFPQGREDAFTVAFAFYLKLFCFVHVVNYSFYSKLALSIDHHNVPLYRKRSKHPLCTATWIFPSSTLRSSTSWSHNAGLILIVYIVKLELTALNSGAAYCLSVAQVSSSSNLKLKQCISSMPTLCLLLRFALAFLKKYKFICFA